MAKRKRRSHSSRPSNLYSRTPEATPAELDIVIPVYGRLDLLKKCLDTLAIAALDVDYQIIIVDDHSPGQEETELYYSTIEGRAKIHRNAKNFGFPHAANQGAALGRAPSILFLNSDVMLQPGAVRAMLSSLWGDNSPDGPITPRPGAPVGVVAPMLIFPNEDDVPPEARNKVQHAGLAINSQGKPFHVHIGWSPDNPRVTEPQALQAVTGACLMTRRNVWDEVWQNYKKTGDPTNGAFNEVYGLGTFEDVEYCFAVRGNGYQVVYDPAAVGYHYVGASVIQREGGGYPLGRNYSIFNARCGHLMIWDEWLLW